MIKLYERIYEAIAGAAVSELPIAYFIFVVVSISPIYAIIIKDRIAGRKHEAEKQARYLEREKEVIAVVKENSTAISSLTKALENQDSKTTKSIERINDRIDKVADDMSQIKFILSGRERVNTKNDGGF